jgi:hypothetical protein
MHGALLEGRPLRAGSDLKRVFVAAMFEWIEAGWQLGEFSSTGGVFFCTRGVERRMICIESRDPGRLAPGASFGDVCRYSNICVRSLRMR